MTSWRRITARQVREVAALLTDAAVGEFAMLERSGDGAVHQARLVRPDGSGWVVGLSLAPVDAAEMAEIRRRAEAR